MFEIITKFIIFQRISINLMAFIQNLNKNNRKIEFSILLLTTGGQRGVFSKYSDIPPPPPSLSLATSVINHKKLSRNRFYALV